MDQGSRITTGRAVAIATVLAATAVAHGQGAAFLYISGIGRDVNADGTVVLMTRSWLGQGTYREEISPDRLTSSTTGSYENVLLGPSNKPLLLIGLSRDGSVAVGFGWSAAGQEACRLNGSTLTGMGDLAGGAYSSDATGISGDGSTIVGSGRSASGVSAFVWTAATGMQSIGDLPGGGYNSGAAAISGDGQVVVGYGTSATGVEAMRWTAYNGVMEGLGRLPGGGFSAAKSTSWNGQVVVGQSMSSQGLQAFRWTPTVGMQGLGDLPGGIFESKAVDVSRDGSVIVGTSSGKVDGVVFASHTFICRESRGGGMEALQDVLLAEHGIDVQGDLLVGARAISADGRTIVGTGWLVYLGEKCAADMDDDGDVDIKDLLAFNEAFSTGDPKGDLDNGWGQGHWDGYTDINDLIYFLTRFEEGCQ